MRNKNIYCIDCGEKNKLKDIKCKKCNKKLDPKENLYFDYIKDKVKGDIQDNILETIKKFIIGHLYGIVLTATLIFTITSAVVSINTDEKITETNTKPEILISSLNKCVINGSKELTNVCEEGYSLENNVCKKVEEKDAIENKKCNEGYYLSGNICVSNTNYNKLKKEECLAPNGNNVVGASVVDGVCLVSYCSGYTDGVCSAGSSEPIDFTISYYCPTGTREINGVCKKVINYNTEYTCEEGSLSEKKCLINIEKEATLGCEAGYVLNEECNLCVLGE